MPFQFESYTVSFILRSASKQLHQLRSELLSAHSEGSDTHSILKQSENSYNAAKCEKRLQMNFSTKVGRLTKYDVDVKKLGCGHLDLN